MAAFKATDDDLSGYIGKAEFRHFLRYTLFFYRLWLLFTEMDSSGDGRITEQEFRDCIRDPHGTLQVRFHPDEEVNEAYTLQEWTELGCARPAHLVPGAACQTHSTNPLTTVK